MRTVFNLQERVTAPGSIKDRVQSLLAAKYLQK